MIYRPLMFIVVEYLLSYCCYKLCYRVICKINMLREVNEIVVLHAMNDLSTQTHTFICYAHVDKNMKAIPFLNL